MEWLDEDDEDEQWGGSEWDQDDELQRVEAAIHLRNSIAHYGASKLTSKQIDSTVKVTKIPTTCKAPTSIGDAVKWGWLRKKRDKNKYKTRFAVLTSVKIMYFKSDEDLKKPRGVVPIQGCTVERVPGKDAVLEIISPLMVSKFTFFGKAKKKHMFFFFDSEKDLQEWLIPLKLMANGVKKIREGSPVVHVDIHLRQQWVSEKNRWNQTALHVLASSLGCGLINITESTRIDYLQQKNSSIDLLNVCAWLVSCGCEIDEVDGNNETALHIAINNKLWNLALCLVRLDANVSTVNKDGYTALKRMESDTQGLPPFMKVRLDEILTWKSAPPAAVGQSSHLTAPPYLFEYSYLMLRLMKHSLGTSGEVEEEVKEEERGNGRCGRAIQLPDDSFLSISLYDSKNELIEDVQDLNIPAVNEASQVWWGKIWHMQTPLQNIEPGSFILIRLKNPRELTDVDCPWIRIEIDKETINSGRLEVPWRKRGGKGFTPLSVPNGEIDGTKLDLEVVIPLKAKSMDINLLRRM
jgi:hypothetical protein